MDLPLHIRNAIAVARQAMGKHPDHLLLREQRCAIYAAFKRVTLLPGYRARAHLDILTARFVLPFWRPLAQDRWKGYGYMPETMITLAEGLLNATVDEEEALTIVGRGQEMSDLTGETTGSPYYCSWAVFETALHTLFAALDYNDMKEARISPTFDSEQKYVADAAHLAAVAYAGGRWYPIIAEDNRYGEVAGIWDWDIAEVRTKRQQFWEWWLHEAIPAAWAAQ